MKSPLSTVAVLAAAGRAARVVHGLEPLTFTCAICAPAATCACAPRDNLALRWEFYGTCYRASGRRRLVAEVERLYRRSERYNRLVLSTPERFRESLDRYEAFHAASLENDGTAAERIVQDSLRWAVDRAGGDLPSEA